MSLKKSFILAGMALLCLAACTSKTTLAPLAPVDNATPVNTIWYKHVGASTKVVLSKYTPAVSGTQLFTSDSQGNVVALSLQNGDRLWETRLKAAASGGVAVGNEMLFVPTIKGSLCALNQKNGELIWQTTLPNQSNTAPTYANGQVFVKTIDDKVVALSASTGQIQWTYDEGATQLQLLGSSRPVVVGNQVIAGFSDGEVDAIGRTNGVLLWQALIAVPTGFSDMGRMIGVFADPIVVGNTIYAASYQGSLSAIDINNGSIKWQVPLSDYAGIAVSNNKVVAVTPDGDVLAFNASNGAQVWKQTALEGRQLSGPAIDGNKVVLGDDQGNVHWLALSDGHFTSRTYVGKSAVAVTPLVVNDKVIVSSINGNMFVMQVGS